jgi:hypothetical protein
LQDKYGIRATIQKRGKEGCYRIYLNKWNAKVLKSVIDPYFKESCSYKFRSVKQKW